MDIWGRRPPGGLNREMSRILIFEYSIFLEKEKDI
jgi:hypothetical protein